MLCSSARGIISRFAAKMSLLLCRCYEADEGRLSLPSLSFVHLGTKEIDKWTKQPPRQLPRIFAYKKAPIFVQSPEL
jgi:hypothetical protein